MDAEQTFKVGDVVMLKSGSPAMVVTSVLEVEGESSIVTQWFDEARGFTGSRFDAAILEAAEECDGSCCDEYTGSETLN